MYTLADLIKQANESGDAGLIALAAGGQSYLDGLYGQFSVPAGIVGNPFPHTVVCNTITDLEFFDNFRLDIANHIIAISDALEQLP